MRSITGALLAALSLCIVADRSAHSDPEVRPLEIQHLLDAAGAAFVAADYARAKEIYNTTLHKYQNLRKFDKASILIGLGNCELWSHNYSEALRHYESASVLASAERFIDHQLVIATNKATVYRRMGDTTSALQLMRATESLSLRSNNPLIITQFATVNRDIAFPRSLILYGMALDRAAALGDRRAESVIWNHIGTAYEERGEFTEAEHAFTEAFRIRTLTGRKVLQPSYFHLGKLRWKQGDFRSAIQLLNKARELAGTPDGPIQLPYIHHALALAYYSGGQTTRALEEFDAAFHAIHEWRLQVLPADSFRVSTENSLQQMFADYVTAGMSLYSKLGDERIAARMLEVAESSRNFLAQRALVEQKQLPANYRQTIAQYRRALAKSLGSSDDTAIAEAQQIRLRLSEMETQLGINTVQQTIVDNASRSFHNTSIRVRVSSALNGLRPKLKPSEAFLSFYSGAAATYLWAVTRHSFEVHRIQGRSELGAMIQDFRSALTEKKTNVRTTGEVLSKRMLGSLSLNVRSKREWILSLDGPLFDLPFAALPEGDGWLGEHHALRHSSSALGEQGAPVEALTDEFVAVADPVYNRADPRHTFEKNNAAEELPRLPGTGREATACARAWGRDEHAKIFTGTAILRENLMESIARKPAVLHLATHVIPHPTFPDQVLVALGFPQSGHMDYLTPADIAFSRMPVGVVTLSGCGSGRGAALPGLGLFGLTRAWLMAGVTAVVASHWPIADDSGELLAVMYERLGQSTGRLSPSKVADALQAAQRRMIGFGGWRADPVYWSAFAVIGKD